VADFDRNDIEKSFNTTILSRGSQYFRTRQVLDAWYDEFGDLIGRVRGTRPLPYEVNISFEPRRNYTKLTSDCSCPYGDQCKHGAAVALYALANDLRTEEVEDDEVALEDVPIVLPTVPPVSLEITVPQDIRDWINHVNGAIADIHKIDPTAKARVFYRLQNQPIAGGAEIPTLTPISRNTLKSGGFGAITEIKHSTILSNQMPKHWTWFDAIFIKDLNVNAARIDWNKAEYRLDAKHGTRLLREALASERCTWGDGATLKLGEPRRGKFEWEVSGKKGVVTPKIKLVEKAVVLATTEPWYVDLNSSECGPINCGLPTELVAALIRRGPIQPEHISVCRGAFTRMGFPEELLPQTPFKVTVRAPQLVPCLSIEFEACPSKPNFFGPSVLNAPVAFAKLTFEYEGVKAPADGGDVRVVDGEELSILKRNLPAERNARTFLTGQGWRETTYLGWEIPKGRGSQLCITPSDAKRLLDPLEKVTAFAKNVVPKLVEANWKVNIDENFRFVPESEVEWDIAVEGGSGIDWFEFKLGIRVEGEPFDLKSVLAEVFKDQTNERLLSPSARNSRTDDIFVFGLNGRVIKLSRKRLSGILQPLVELFGGVSEWPDELRLPTARLPEAAKFEESASAVNIPWKTGEELKRLRRQFETFDHLEPLTEPVGFTGQLRHYQQEGLAWLQFLREFGFGGVLADDMGLGKTVQILAHIQTEKISGRMDRPCLIVAPTSTMPNWRRECEHFAPELKVLTLQGTSRTGRFANLKDVDIALTTYPLLARDKDQLMKANYHLLVLDEAQSIKNPTTAAAKAVRELDARHRVCLSGTPVENHLGELWALFHFLMPGFLGSSADFTKQFRGPIEKSGDAAARQLLARRIRPFMLRRTKTQVVQELPAKTEIIESVAFEDPQRDLYESIRTAMDEQVRNLIASQGFDKSRIQILDALLKLRQVCCDPRLVKLPSAKSVTVSAKLDRLMEMLGVLIEDGRRVLLFSQFTSMLDLIEERLRTDGIQWVRISGDTTDRETPVKRFQACEVPLFLISLKAGGTGLNLTAADTVILYDPWWNPAVENQAIDRAHRIGQEKAVIVYKLVASGTIEEKMLEMQTRKGDIARSILTDDAEGIRTLTADDLKWVLSRD
jgi:superfamily II DNA or RNA helicase